MFCQCVIDYDQDLGPGQFFVAENPLQQLVCTGPLCHGIHNRLMKWVLLLTLLFFLFEVLTLFPLKISAEMELLYHTVVLNPL